jgi:TPR repeat protein
MLTQDKYGSQPLWQNRVQSKGRTERTGLRATASKDLTRAAHYFKLAADQGYAVAQFNSGLCLH